MRPSLFVAEQDLGRVTVVITPIDSEASTDEFRHIARRTQDPRERYQAALRYLQAAHFQDPNMFDDGLTAVFGADAELPTTIDGRDDCVLVFEQFSQRYTLPCEAACIGEGDPVYQATYWHNALFNPGLPARVAMLRFRPDWTSATADPYPI